MNNDKYSKTFLDPAYANSYEVRYSGHSYDDVLWNIEKHQLLKTILYIRESHRYINYLDFAVGTGRIIAFMENYVDSAIGIDISPAMIEIAKQKVKHSSLHCADITQPMDIITEKYDCITAFRFFLNADHSLKSRVIRVLAELLRDDKSRLIFNNHGNLWSHKLIMWPINTVCNIGKCYEKRTHYMSLSQAKVLAENAGLVIDKVMGCGLLSPKARWILPFNILLNIESRLAKSTFARYFGVNQTYIARKKGTLAVL